MGNSFTFGCWADRVENSLMGAFEKNVSPERWEILNFGVGGYGMADIELQLQEDVLEFSPRYVVMVLFTGNDFRDTYLGIENNIIVDGTALQNHELLNSKVPPRYRQPDLSMPTASREPAKIRRALRRLALFRFLAPHLDMEHLAVDFTVSQNFQNIPSGRNTPIRKLRDRRRMFPSKQSNESMLTFSKGMFNSLLLPSRRNTRSTRAKSQGRLST